MPRGNLTRHGFYSILALVCCGAVLAVSGCKSDDDPVVKTQATAGAAGANSSVPEGPMLAAAPVDALDDDPVTIIVSGIKPGAAVTIHAETADAVGQHFAAEAQFSARANGRVELVSDAPVSGSYSGVNAMGLFWSMLPVGAAAPNAVQFNPVPLTARQLSLTATVEGEPALTQTIMRRSVLDETRVTRVEVADQGLVGVFFSPASTGPHPTLLVLGGSEGGMPEGRAALLASHGYAALALAYFGAVGLPTQLASIPLEYFETAFAWLEQQPAVDMTRFGVMGSSKGGELALLLASRYPTKLHAVVAYVPSSVVWQGIPKGPAAVGSSWSYQGADLPYVPMAFTSEETGHFMRNEPQALTPAYVRSLENTTAVEAAAIAVENIAGPILLISAGDDAIWPSRSMSEAIATRLTDKAHAFGYVHRTYDGAGHLISHPYLPTSLEQYGLNLFGGSPAATAAACVESWREVSEFLSVSLK